MRGSFFAGLGLGLALIVVIGALNAFVLRQCLRRRPLYVLGTALGDGARRLAPRVARPRARQGPDAPVGLTMLVPAASLWPRLVAATG